MQALAPAGRRGCFLAPFVPLPTRGLFLALAGSCRAPAAPGACVHRLPAPPTACKHSTRPAAGLAPHPPAGAQAPPLQRLQGEPRRASARASLAGRGQRGRAGALAASCCACKRRPLRVRRLYRASRGALVLRQHSCSQSWWSCAWAQLDLTRRACAVPATAAPPAELPLCGGCRPRRRAVPPRLPAAAQQRTRAPSSVTAPACQAQPVNQHMQGWAHAGNDGGGACRRR